MPYGNDTHVNWPECRMGWCIIHSYSPVGPNRPPSWSFCRTQLVSGYTPTGGPTSVSDPGGRGEGDGEKEGGWGNNAFLTQTFPRHFPFEAFRLTSVLISNEFCLKRRWTPAGYPSSPPPTPPAIIVCELYVTWPHRVVWTGTTPRETRSLLSPVKEPFHVVSFFSGSVRVFTTHQNMTKRLLSQIQRYFRNYAQTCRRGRVLL